MTYIGIDFSLNSPGICVQDNQDKYHFLSFFNYGKRIWDEEGIRIPKAFWVHKELADDDALSCFAYNREVHSKEFIYRERETQYFSLIYVVIYANLFAHVRALQERSFSSHLITHYPQSPHKYIRF